MTKTPLAIAITLAALFNVAHAGVVGGSTLINSAAENQLESWLGQGQLSFTNIFTKLSGSTSQDFHAAADGQGATFSLMSASLDGVNWKTIGGYNPNAWNSIGNYNMTTSYDAFVFNLADGLVWNQLNGYQTFNTAVYGPSFGGGHDLYVDASLSSGYSFGYSYGSYGVSILDGSAWTGQQFMIRALEVFTVSAEASQVPEPGSLALLCLGLVGLGGLAASRKRQAA